MKVGVYFCCCGSNVSERIDPGKVERAVSSCAEFAHFATVEYLCSVEGKEFLKHDLIQRRPDRVVIAACSPREYERAFRQVLAEAGMNPYFLQMVNIRELIAWTTPNADQACQKACTAIRAGMARAALHVPLEKKRLEMCPDVAIIGAGPAGLKAALTLGTAGRKVTLLEKSPFLGGNPVRFEELYPAMECAPCLLEPLQDQVMHGEPSEHIEILTLAEATEVSGYFGNFNLKIRQKPRYVDAHACIGCNECIAPCPVDIPNEFNAGMDQRKAIAFPFAGALPNVPFIETGSCLRLQGNLCQACRDACPVEGAIDFEQKERLLERKVGAIILAVGAALADVNSMAEFGYGTNPDVVTSFEFERILAANGPTGGTILNRAGKSPESVAIIHCAGSLEEKGVPYCSEICCGYAMKFDHLIRGRLPDSQIHHFYKEMVLPEKEGFALFRHLRHEVHSHFYRYNENASLSLARNPQERSVISWTDNGVNREIAADLVILCPPMVPAQDAASLSQLFEAPLDRYGFFEALHSRTDAAQSRVKGIFLAGTCQAPMNLPKAMNQGAAAAAHVLSGLVEGRTLEIEPITAEVDEGRCSGCRTCRHVCPYKAIGYAEDKKRASVNALLCQGCGTCVAACPAGAIRGNHFTSQQVSAEIEAILT